MAYRYAWEAVANSQQVYDQLERECVRVIAEIDVGTVRLQDLNTGIRELCEVSVIVLANAKATANFDQEAKNQKGAAYEATVQADNVLAAVNPVRSFLKANWPTSDPAKSAGGNPPQTVEWLNALADNAEIKQSETTDAAFLGGLRPLLVTLQGAANTANDDALAGEAQQRVAQRQRALR